VNKAIGTKNDGTENLQSDTPGQRQLVIVDRSGLWKGKPVKTLTEGLDQAAAATTPAVQTATTAVAVTSAPTAWSISSVASSTFGTVERIEYDPNRTAFIALIKYETATCPTFWRRSA
jgi:large subunit ribosomal protein L2